MSCFMCCFKTISLCGLRDCIINAFAFQPPKTRNYDVQQIEPGDTKKAPLYKFIIPGSKQNPLEVPGIEASAHWLYTKTNKKIPALFFFNKACTNNMVILYSHGNATDLGMMRPYLLDMAFTLNTHVFAFEYFGYGPTKGSPNDTEVVFDAIAAYDELVNKMGFKWHQIILYGRSIGTGPSLYLASHPKYPVTGVILHSPIASGLRMFDLNMKKTDNRDLYPNCDLIEHVKAPVFIIHGEADEDVPLSHGKLLSTKCKNLFQPWWVPEGSHNNIDIKFRRTYFIKLSRFIKHIKDINAKKTDFQLEKMYKAEDWHDSFDHIYFTREKVIEEKWKKAQREKRIPKDYYLVPSNSSFVNSQNITTSSFKNNTGESLFTTMGDQTSRKNGTITARSNYEPDAGKDSNDNTTYKIASTDRSLLKEQSMQIELSSRFKPNILKASEIENSETPRAKDDEKESNNQPCEGKENFPSPYDISFDNSQFVTEMKSGGLESVSKHEVEAKKTE